MLIISLICFAGKAAPSVRERAGITMDWCGKNPVQGWCLGQGTETLTPWEQHEEGAEHTEFGGFPPKNKPRFGPTEGMLCWSRLDGWTHRISGQQFHNCTVSRVLLVSLTKSLIFHEPQKNGEIQDLEGKKKWFSIRGSPNWRNPVLTRELRCSCWRNCCNFFRTQRASRWCQGWQHILDYSLCTV